MKSNKLANKKIKVNTQKYLDIAEIREDCVILKDGTLRAVLLVSSINFSLKSEDEQNAIVGAYVNFLNFLDFPLQIVIQSRRLDIDSYLSGLKKIEKEQTNELLKMQTAEYRQYVTELVQLAEIMTKKFFIVVPYDPSSDKQKSWFKKFFELFSVAQEIKISQEQFLKRKHSLDQRVEHVTTQINSMGLKSVVLDTQGLIELFYNTYNPDIAQAEKLTAVEKLKIES